MCRGCGPAPSRLRAGVEKKDAVVEVVGDVGAVPRHEEDGVDDGMKEGRCRSGEHAGGCKFTGASLH